MTHEETLVALDALVRLGSVVVLSGIFLFTVANVVRAAFWCWDRLSE